MAVFDDDHFDPEFRLRHHGFGRDWNDYFQPGPEYPFYHHDPELYKEYESMLDNLFGKEPECVTREYYRFDYRRKTVLIELLESGWQESVSKFKPEVGPSHLMEEFFWNLKHLRDDRLPHSLVKERFEACARCPKLTEIELPVKLAAKGYRAFRNCVGRVRVEVPEGVTSIDTMEFFGFKALTSVKLPESLSIIEDYAFRDCMNLSEINLPKGLMAIKTGAFSGCYSLSDLRLPNGLIMIFRLAFLGCMSLTHIRIPRSVDIIDTAVFRGCYSLESIELPDTVRYIKDNAFRECPSLRKVYVDCSPDSGQESILTYFGSLFPGCEVKVIAN